LFDPICNQTSFIVLTDIETINSLPFVIIRYLLPYELYIDGREYKHLFTKAETGREPKRAKVPSKSSGNKDKASVQHGKKSEAAREQRKAKPLQPGVISQVASCK